VRMKAYDNQTAPLLGYYRSRDLVAEVAGVGTIDAVSDAVEQALT